MNSTGANTKGRFRWWRRRERAVPRGQRSVGRLLWCVLALLPVFAAVYFFSYWLRFEGRLGPIEWQWFSSTALGVVLIKLTVFGWFRVDRGWGRLVTFDDLLLMVQAASTALLLTVLADRFFLTSRTIPRSVFLLDWGVTIVLLGGVRAALRVLGERDWSMLVPRGDKVPTLIVGADDAGESLLRSIRRSGRLLSQVVGFVDHRAERIGTSLGGVKVVGHTDEIGPIAFRLGVGEVLIGTDALSGRQIRGLVDECRRRSIGVKILPSYEQLISGRIATQPRRVSINDLLRREPVKLDLGNIRQWIDDRTLWVTGSAGSIGSEIARQLVRFAPKRIVLVDRSETGQFFLQRELRRLDPNVEIDIQMADLLDRGRMEQLFAQYRPDIIFHAAAYKHVPLMESHPGEAVKNITQATRRLADLATEHGVESFVLISTDKAVNPTSVMGTCKRAAELYVQSRAGVSDCRFVTVRFGNVLDSSGSVVQVFRQQIAAGGPITVTDPRVERYFMTIPEAARLVIQAGAIGQGGEILVLDMGEPVRIVELAADMIRLSGLKVGRDIEITFTGLRAGEKLYEELYASGENHLPTSHPKIMVADCRPCDPGWIDRSIDALVTSADGDPMALAELLCQIVPEYGRGEPTHFTKRAVAA